MVHRSGVRFKTCFIAATLLAIEFAIADRAASQTLPPDPTTPAQQTPPAQPVTPAPTTTPAKPVTPAQAAEPDPGPFAAGQKRFGITAGYSSNYGEDYLFIGGGLAYFIADGVDLGIDLEAWFLGDPTYYKLSPQLRYTYWKLGNTKPYVGAFYRRTFVENFEDFDSFGGRGGIYHESSSGAIVGAGIVYERLVDCEDGFSGDCDEFYPEFVFALSF